MKIDLDLRKKNVKWNHVVNALIPICKLIKLYWSEAAASQYWDDIAEFICLHSFKSNLIKAYYW